MGTTKTLKAHEIADALGVSKRYVQMVLNGDRHNPKIIEASAVWDKEHNQTKEAVKRIVTDELK